MIGAQTGRAVVHVGDIAWLRLEHPQHSHSDGQAIVQLGDTLHLTLLAGAGPGDGENPYPSQQYVHMPLQVQVDNLESVGVRPVASQPGQYIVHALSTGVARVIISVKTSSGRVVSSASKSVRNDKLFRIIKLIFLATHSAYLDNCLPTSHFAACKIGVSPWRQIHR